MNDEMQKPQEKSGEETKTPDEKKEPQHPVLTPRQAAAIYGNLRLEGFGQRRRYPYSRM